MSSLTIDWNLEQADPALVEFIPGFQENRKKEVIELKGLLGHEDFTGMQKLGHNWKGFSRPYGYLALEKMGIALEQAARAKDLPRCREIFQQFLFYINEKEARLAGSPEQ